MFKTFINAWRTKEIRSKMIFVVIILVLYRFGAVVPVPYINTAIGQSIQSYSGTIFDYLNILSGNAFSKATLFALSVSPYITASIIIQLLTIAIPALERLSKSGEDGQKKITQITRYVTVGLGLITAFGYYKYVENLGWLTNTGIFAACVIIGCYAAGAALIMWLAEKINESGIGNGISLILFANIVSGGYSTASTLISQVKEGGWNILFAVISVVLALLIVTFVVFVTNSERRLPVQYAKRVVGRKMYGGQNTNLPIKLNMSGVMPIIFANSIAALPSTLAVIFTPTEGSWWYKFVNSFNYTSWVYVVIFLILIVAFSYFYISISFNPTEVSNNLKKNGGFIPGIRPGKPTADYITKVLNKVTLMGAVFLGIIAAIPMIINICASSQLGALAFGGSSLLIVVGVVLETARELEAQMTMRHYKGFLE